MRFELKKAALLFGAAALALPAAATAQDTRTVSGNIQSAPQTFTASVPGNSVMQIDVISTSDLDPTVTVREAGSDDLLAENDDFDGSLNSRVRIPGGDEGLDIVIEVNSFDAGWAAPGEQYGGTFNLVMATMAFEPPGPVTYGSRVMGRYDGEPVLYTFDADAGDMIEVTLLSNGDLDPYLELRNSGGETIAFDDDGGYGGNGLNSLITYTFSEAGTYTIAALGFGESRGDYTLRVREEREAPAAQLPLQVIGLNDTATGVLGSPWTGDGSLPATIDYQLSESAMNTIRRGNGHVSIRMNSSDGGDPDFGGSIDPLIEVGFETPLGWAPAMSDDDGGGELNSLLPIDLSVLDDHPDMLEMLRIRVQGFGGSSGAYTLRITEGLEQRMTFDAMEEAMEMAD